MPELGPDPKPVPEPSRPPRFKDRVAVIPDKPNPTRDDDLQAKKDATPVGLAWVKPEDIANATLSVDAADCSKWS